MQSHPHGPPTEPHLPERRSLPHAQPYAWDAIYLITINAAQRGVNTLALPEIAPLLWQEWCGYEERATCTALLLVVMPDHIHGLFRFPADPGLCAVIRAWKRLTARRYGIVWQRDFFDHRLRSDESFEEKAAYIRNNPVRKEFVNSADAWPYAWPVLG